MMWRRRSLVATMFFGFPLSCAIPGGQALARLQKAPVKTDLTKAPSLPQDLIDRLQAEQIIIRAWRALDMREDEALLSMLTDDCRWFRVGRMEVGKTQLRASLSERNSSFLVRHVVSNLLVDRRDGHLFCTYYMRVYSSHDPGPGPRPSGAPYLVSDVTTRLDRVDNGWLIGEIIGTPQFLTKIS